MISPRNLDRLANVQEKRGAKVFYRALKQQALALVKQYENGQDLQPDTRIIKSVLEQYHIKTAIETAEWQYNDLVKNNRAKALQLGMYDRMLSVIRAWVLLNTGASIKSISNTTLKWVQKMIASGQEQGWGARKIAANIRKEVPGEFTAYRATVIGRTEGTRAASYGHKVGAEQWEKITGQKKWKGWSASADKRTRDFHRAMIDSNPIPGDQDFIVGGEAMDAPGDPRGGTKNVVSCRCRAYYMSERAARKLL